MARQDSRHESPEKGRDVERTYSSKTGTVKMDRPCFRMPKENPLWRTRNGQTLLWWSEEVIQRHPQSSPQGFQHTNRVMGTNCTGPSKVVRPHQKRCTVVNMRQKESAKPSRNVHSAKPELRHHQQSCLALTSVVPSATDSLELGLV